MTGPLDGLTTDKLHLAKVEAAGVDPLTELTLLDQSGPGYVKSLWMALGGGNNPTLDGRIRVYYDNNPTPDIDIDVGTLFATHWGAGATYGSHSCQHMHVEINAQTLNTALLMTFPMPFGDNIRIAYYNPGSSQGAIAYSMATYALTDLDLADGKRLRCQGARFMDQAQTRQPGDVTTFADIQGGPGWIIYHAYVGGINASSVSPSSPNNDSWMERNISISVDGEPTPSIVSTGTEDWFDSGWYYEGWRDFQTSIHSYVGTNKPDFQPNTVGMVTDLMSKWGGVPFVRSAVVQAQTESNCVTGDVFCYAILYYQ